MELDPRADWESARWERQHAGQKKVPSVGCWWLGVSFSFVHSFIHPANTALGQTLFLPLGIQDQGARLKFLAFVSCSVGKTNPSSWMLKIIILLLSSSWSGGGPDSAYASGSDLSHSHSGDG